MDNSFYGGFLHPLVGLEHLLAMFAVGLWAFEQGRKLTLALPMLFVSLMALGVVLGLCNVPLPFVTPGIMVSVLIMGLLVASAKNLHLTLSLLLISTFAILHGYAHSSYLPVNGEIYLDYVLGFIIATSLLHALGVIAGQILHHFVTKDEEDIALRIGGTGIALAGGVMLAGLL